MTQVCEITLGTTLWTWLCGQCQAARAEAGWTVKRHKVIAFGCDQCSRELERYRDAVSPPVDYVPTAADSYCPPSDWEAPPMPETWAARLELRKAIQRAVEKKVAR